MNRPTGGSGTTIRPGSPKAPRPWPTRPEWVSATVLTIGLVVVIGFYTYIADQIFGYLFGLIHH